MSKIEIGDSSQVFLFCSNFFLLSLKTLASDVPFAMVTSKVYDRPSIKGGKLGSIYHWYCASFKFITMLKIQATKLKANQTKKNNKKLEWKEIHLHTHGTCTMETFYFRLVHKERRTFNDNDKKKRFMHMWIRRSYSEQKKEVCILNICLAKKPLFGKYNNKKRTPHNGNDSHHTHTHTRIQKVGKQ